MNLKKYNALYNFLWFQMIWFIAVLGGDNYIMMLAVLLVGHLLLVDEPSAEAQFMLTGAAIGITMDNILTYLGFYSFNPDRSLLDVPFWLMAIWLGFCATFRHCMKFMTKKPLLLILATAVVAPLNYFAAGNFGAVEFPKGDFYTALVTGFSWMIVMAVLLFIDQFLSRNTQSHLHEQKTPLAT